MSFKQIKGQEAAVKILQDDLTSRRIHHAYLFVGKDGVGKRSLAYEFARAIHCELNTIDSCDHCLSCRKLEHNNHPDLKLVEIEDGDSIKIEQIRELQKELAYKPLESEHKVIIIDQAHQMTIQAANSLLKTLEEPPEYAVIILLVDEVRYGQLLPTVISRCQKVFLQGIAAQTIHEELKKRHVDEEKAGLIAQLADGSLGKAYFLADDQDFFEKRNSILTFLHYLPESSTVEVFNQADKLLDLLKEKERDVFPVFDLILNWYRDIILYNQGYQKGLVNTDFCQEIKADAQKYSLDELIAIIRLVNNIKEWIAKNVRQDLALQVMLFKIRAKRV